MNKAYKLTLMLGFIGSFFLGHSQISLPIINNNTNYTLLNPAFAGIDDGYFLGTRSAIYQHWFTPRPFYYNTIAFNGKLKKINSGVGVNINHEHYKYSTRNYPHHIPDSVHGHYNFYYHSINGKLSYNYQLKLGDANSLALGASGGIIVNRRIHQPELTDGKVTKSTASVFEVGMRYAYKSLYIGGSLTNIIAKQNNNNTFEKYFSLITGVNITLHKNFALEPSFILKIGRQDDLFKFQNNVVFLKNYNVGAGYNLNWFREGYHLFAGVQIKQKIGIRIAYEKHVRRYYEEGNNYWLNAAGLELNLCYKLN